MIRFRVNLTHSFNFIDLTPLVDVLFLLLIFFLFTADILPLKSLPIQTPKIARDSAPLTSQLFVVMDRNEVIYLGSRRKIVSLPSLTTRLKEEMEIFSTAHEGHKPTVVLSIDESVPYASFLELYSACSVHADQLKLVYQPK